MAGGSRWPATYASPVPYGPVDAALDLPALEEQVLARWRAEDLFGQVRAWRADAPPWIFYEGPPTANGRPGLHHVWARVFKDLYPRFQTMRGHAVPRQAGWDSHGLPVEIEVEKELGLRSKQEIEAYGVAAFNERCRESVSRYVQDWIALTDRSGIWFDTEHAYWTMSNDFIESVWWLVRQLWDAGLLYEGHRVTPYCPRCGTALSSHELGQPDVYRDVVDPSVFVRFPVVDRDVDLLVWTTTPWTLVSNVAVAVGPDIRYVRIAAPDGGRDLVVAAAAADRRWPGAEVVRDLDRAGPGGLALPPTVRSAARRRQRRAGSCPPTSWRPTKARGSSTWPRPSARPTRSSGGRRGSRSSTRSDRTARSTIASPRGRGAS